MFKNKPKSALAAGLMMGASPLMLAPALAQTALPPVQVTGEQTGSYAPTNPDLVKLTEPLLDTPISVVTVTRQLMDDRGDTSLTDVFRNVPSVTMESGESSWQGNDPYIRGFNARTDMFVDGMRDFGFYYRDPFNLEDVEVLEGPDSILFGRGSTGGVIEQTSKMPKLDGFTNVSLSGGTNDLARATADVDVPIDGLGTPAAMRVNVMVNTNGVAERDQVLFQRFGFAPTLSLGIGEPDRVTISYFHQSESDLPDFGLPWYFGAPPPVSRDNFYGYKSDRLNTSADIGTVTAAHDFSDDLTVRNELRYSDYHRRETGSKPALAASVTPATPLASAGVTINSFSLNSQEQEMEDDLDFMAKFDTGEIHHDLTAGVEYDWESSTPSVFNNNGLTNTLLTPNENQNFAPTATVERVAIDTTTNTEGIYLMDTMKLADQFEAILGARFDRFSPHFSETVFSTTAPVGAVTAHNVENHVDEMPSWHAALIWKPEQNGSVYFTYATSFDPSAETLDEITSFTSFSLNNAALDPERNRTFELGTKWSLFDNQLLASGSLFQTDKYNARIPNPVIPSLDELAGDEQVQGFELLAQGAITPLWNVSVGYDYLSSDTTKTTPGGPPLGFPLPFVARNNLTFWSTYRIMPDLVIGAGGQYLSARYAQTTAPIEQVPGYVTFDAMARYSVTPKIDLQVNIYNIADTYYYDVLHPAFVVLGRAVPPCLRSAIILRPRTGALWSDASPGRRMVAGLCVLALHGLVIWGFAADFHRRNSFLYTVIPVQVFLLPKPIEPLPAPQPAPRLINAPAIAAIRPVFTITEPRTIRATQPASPAVTAHSATGNGSGSAPMAPPPDYLSRLVAHLNAYKNYPYEARIHREQGTVRLRFAIDRQGHVLSYEVVGSSGHPDLDDEARQMIQRADPFPPTPPEFHGERLDLEVPLVFSLN